MVQKQNEDIIFTTIVQILQSKTIKLQVKVLDKYVTQVKVFKYHQQNVQDHFNVLFCQYGILAVLHHISRSCVGVKSTILASKIRKYSSKVQVCQSCT